MSYTAHMHDDNKVSFRAGSIDAKKNTYGNSINAQHVARCRSKNGIYWGSDTAAAAGGGGEEVRLYFYLVEFPTTRRDAL